MTLVLRRNKIIFQKIGNYCPCNLILMVLRYYFQQNNGKLQTTKTNSTKIKIIYIPSNIRSVTPKSNDFVGLTFWQQRLY